MSNTQKAATARKPDTAKNLRRRLVLASLISACVVNRIYPPSGLEDAEERYPEAFTAVDSDLISNADLKEIAAQIAA